MSDAQKLDRRIIVVGSVDQARALARKEYEEQLGEAFLTSQIEICGRDSEYHAVYVQPGRTLEVMAQRYRKDLERVQDRGLGVTLFTPVWEVCVSDLPFEARVAAPNFVVDEGRPNTGWLEYIRCPNCGQRRSFDVMTMGSFRIDDSGAAYTGDVEWDETHPCTCADCGFGGTRAEFTEVVERNGISVEGGA